jgi:hypothetical protein
MASETTLFMKEKIVTEMKREKSRKSNKTQEHEYIYDMYIEEEAIVLLFLRGEDVYINL